MKETTIPHDHILDPKIEPIVRVLADPGGTGNEVVSLMADPLARGQLVDGGAFEPARMAEVDWRGHRAVSSTGLAPSVRSAARR